ncbi:hypothetical protein PV08_03034 [Exophiala spinifera]|uniref:Uncharacterized protein n=1 Tax=Exophiala spinifera TaxID=91928 RepID=A0A0D2BJG3_9EURO|nr:uncharacterized protein PV08_03034 [Exophiala spinifera]KIW18745.1 hypothetical protein PV08_03034 [Exophiala spinifera]
MAPVKSKKGRQNPQKRGRRYRHRTQLTTAQKMARPLSGAGPNKNIQQQGPVSEEERVAMFNTIKHFTQVERDLDVENDILLLFKSRQPALYHKHINSEPYGPDDLSSDVTRGINGIIQEHAKRRDLTKDMNINVPQHVVTEEMKDFNDKYMGRLPEARYNELQGLVETVYPAIRMSGDLPSCISSSQLPDNVNIMINRYVKMHLPDAVKEEIRREEEEKEEVDPEEDIIDIEDDVGFADDIDFDL